MKTMTYGVKGEAKITNFRRFLLDMKAEGYDQIINRLMKCGMSREVAVYVLRWHLRNKGIKDFEIYVDEIEEASRYPEDEI